MVRLTVVSQTVEEAVVTLDGWLEGADVELVEREGTGYLRDSRSLVLDLSGVRSIDQCGIALLLAWSHDRVSLCGGSLFLRTLLRVNGLDLPPQRERRDRRG